MASRDLRDRMEEWSVNNPRAVIRAHRQRVLIQRQRLALGAIIITILLLWGLHASHLLTQSGPSLPTVNSIELCVLVVAVTQLHRPWCRRHISGLSVALCVQLIACVVLYGLWTGNLWILSLRLTTLSLGAAAVLPWGVACQGIVTAASTLGFAFVHWSLNGTLDHLSTMPTLVVLVMSVPLAFWLEQTHADLAREIERRQTAEGALRQATEGAKIAVWHSDLRARKVRFASGWKRLLGRDTNEISLSDLWDLIHPEDRARSTAAMQQYLQRRASAFETEQRMLHADGSYRWVLSRGVVIYDAEGAPHGLLGADIDITERKDLEEALRRSEDKYRQLVEAINETIYALDTTGIVTYVSPAVESTYGYKPAEIVGRPFSDFVPAKDIPRLSEALSAVLSGQPPYIEEHEVVAKSGDIRWVRNSTRAVVEGAGGPSVRGVLVDLTDRQRMEQELQQLTNELDMRVIERTRKLSEALNQLRLQDAALQAAPDAVAISDDRGRIQWVNPAFTRLTGYGLAEVTGHTHHILDSVKHDEAFFQTFYEQLLKTVNAGESYRTEIVNRRKDGSLFTAELVIAGVRDARGAITNYVTIQHDISERKRAEERTALLLQLTSEIAGTLDPHALLDGVQRRVAQELPCDAVVTLLVDPARGVLRIAGDYGMQPDWRAALAALELRADGGFGEDVAGGQPLVINDFGGPGVLAELAAQVPIGALAAVTLRVHGEFLGRLCAVRLRGGTAFTAADVDLLSGIAQQLAIGLESSRFYEAQREEASVSGALARVGGELIAHLNTPRLLERLCQVTTEVLHCDVSSTFFRNPEKREWSGVATFGNPAEYWESLKSVPMSEAPFAPQIEHLARNGILQMPAADVASSGSPGVTLALQSGLAFVAFVALRRGEKLIGVQSAGWYSRSGRLSPEEKRIARGIGQMASIALDHFRIFSELERANRLKSDFLATMSHELRTPLNIIMGYNALLLDEVFGSLTADQADTVRRTQASAQELLELISATLDISRLDTGRIPLNLEAIDLGDLLDTLVAEMAERYKKPLVALVCDALPQLPRIRTDVMKLQLVMKNLLSNAVKFTAEGRVTVSACKRAAGVEIAVADTGIGIAPNLLPLIFEPFQQGESGLKRGYGGVGLGLYIVRRLVELLGGTVTVDTEPGHGSTFRVWLPLDPKATLAQPSAVA
jgi:PAS domain S-box-containing protein